MCSCSCCDAPIYGDVGEIRSQFGICGALVPEPTSHRPPCRYLLGQPALNARAWDPARCIRPPALAATPILKVPNGPGRVDRLRLGTASRSPETLLPPKPHEAQDHGRTASTKYHAMARPGRVHKLRRVWQFISPSSRGASKRGHQDKKALTAAPAVLMCVLFGWREDEFRSTTLLVSFCQHPAATGHLHVSLRSCDATEKCGSSVFHNCMSWATSCHGMSCPVASAAFCVVPSHRLFPRARCPRPNRCGSSAFRKLWTALRVRRHHASRHRMAVLTRRGASW